MISHAPWALIKPGADATVASSKHHAAAAHAALAIAFFGRQAATGRQHKELRVSDVKCTNSLQMHSVETAGACIGARAKSQQSWKVRLTCACRTRTFVRATLVCTSPVPSRSKERDRWASKCLCRSSSLPQCYESCCAPVTRFRSQG